MSRSSKIRRSDRTSKAKSDKIFSLSQIVFYRTGILHLNEKGEAKHKSPEEIW